MQRRPPRSSDQLPAYGGSPAASSNGASSGSYYANNAYGGTSHTTPDQGYAGYGNANYSYGNTATSGGYNSAGYGNNGYASAPAAGYGHAGYVPSPGSSGGIAVSAVGSDPVRRPSRRGRNNGGGLADMIKSLILSPIFWSSFFAFLCFGLAMYYRSNMNRLYSKMGVNNLDMAINYFQDLQDVSDSSRSSSKGLKESLRTANERRSTAEKELRELRKARDELIMKYESPERKNEENRLTKREEAWKTQVDILKRATALESKRTVIEKFGPGPHQVEFAVVFPNDEEKKERFVLLEMAPLDLMPHAVHLFLEQVSHGLWNNAWFYINGPHVLQAGPQADEIDEQDPTFDVRAAALKPFLEKDLASLAFPEYSEEFPHLPWTLGFTGRPGGPDFYINKVDNQLSHGPGGQEHHALEEFADPCFAKVIKGFQTLDDMSKVPTILENVDYRFFFEDPVQIVRAIIITNPISEEAKEATPEHIVERELIEPLEKRKPVKKLQRPQIEHAVEP